MSHLKIHQFNDALLEIFQQHANTSQYRYYFKAYVNGTLFTFEYNPDGPLYLYHKNERKAYLCQLTPQNIKILNEGMWFIKLCPYVDNVFICYDNDIYDMSRNLIMHINDTNEFEFSFHEPHNNFMVSLNKTMYI